MCKLTLTAALCFIIASLGLPGIETQTVPGNLCTGRLDGQYTNPNDPHSFLSCANGETHIMPCPSDLVYVEPTNRCDYPSNTTTNGTLCAGRPDRQYTNPCNQHSFLSCVDGLTYILQCQSNDVYVEAINRCVNLCAGKPDGNYTNPGHTHSFLSCVDGVTSIIRCQPHLVYNPYIKVCEYPSSPTKKGKRCYRKKAHKP